MAQKELKQRPNFASEDEERSNYGGHDGEADPDADTHLFPSLFPLTLHGSRVLTRIAPL